MEVIGDFDKGQLVVWRVKIALNVAYEETREMLRDLS